MYECLYGFTPFACEDRHQTKLKILHHKKALVFPQMENIAEPSIQALDLMMLILVEKEKRLCTRQYELNDFTKKLVGGRLVRCTADKDHQNYEGYFVYPDDAADIKRHAFFKDIDWETVHLRRPPYQPRVKDWEDTRYFEEEDPISDIDTATTRDEGSARADKPGDGRNENLQSLQPPVPVGSQVSQHHQEDQDIVSSMAMKLGPHDRPLLGLNLRPMDSLYDLRNPLLSPCGIDERGVNSWPTVGAKLVGPGVQVDGPTEVMTSENIKPKPKQKEKKRPRDIILRDPVTGPPALEIRKLGAFLGYDYRQPVTVKNIVDQVLAEDLASTKSKEYGSGWKADGTDEKGGLAGAGGPL